MARDKGLATERMAGFIGLLLFLAISGILAYDAVISNDGPPDLSAELVGIDPLKNGFLVRIRVTNDGASTAAEVPVSAILEWDGVIEQRRIILDYVPEASTEEVGFLFPMDPRGARIQLVVEGFRSP